MGLKSFNEDGLAHFGMGHTLAFFRQVGTWHKLRQRLKTVVKAGAKQKRKSLKTQ